MYSRPAALLLLFAASPLAAELPSATRLRTRGEASPGVVGLSYDWPLTSGISRSLQGRMAQLRAAFEREDRGKIERLLIDIDRWSGRKDVGARASLVLADVVSNMVLRGFPLQPSAGLREGEQYADALWRVLREGIGRDPTLTPLRDRFLELSLRGGDRTPRPDQLTAIKLLTAAGTPTGELLLLRARWLRLEGKGDSAETILQQSAALGADRGALGLEGARIALLRGDSAAAIASYWRGLEGGTLAGREGYRTDLRWILDPDSVSVFDRVPDSALVGWLHRFWGERDVAGLKSPDGALLGHLRRYQYVFSNYRVVVPWRRTQFNRVEFGFEGMSDKCPGRGTELYELLARAQPYEDGDIRFREPILDHRGVIYLRHGPPLGTATSLPEEDELASSTTSMHAEWEARGAKRLESLIVLSMRHNESWLYWIDGDWRLLHFRGSAAMGNSAPTTLSSVLPGGAGAWRSRARLIPAYAAAATRMMTRSEVAGPSEWECRMKADSRAGSLLATRSESDSPPIIHSWNAMLQLFAVGSSVGNDGRALLAFAIPLKALSIDTMPAGTSVAVHFDLQAFNRETGERVVLDTFPRYRLEKAPGRRDQLQGWFELPLAPGAWVVAARVKQGDDSAGAYVMRRDVVVPAGNVPAISDILTGVEGGIGPVRVLDGGFQLNSLATWGAAQAVELYVEFSGVPAGTPYWAEFEVKSLDDKQQRPISIRTTGSTDALVTSIRRSLSLRVAGPGLYRISVVITSGQHILRKSKEVQVVK